MLKHTRKRRNIFIIKVLLRNILKSGTKHFKKVKKYVIIGVYALKKVFKSDKYSRFFMLEDFDFSRNSSIGCGGVAPIAFFPNNVEELSSLIECLKQDGVRYCVLGNLTNVLPSDGVAGFAVICTKRMRGIAIGELIFAYAGVTSGELLNVCKHEKRGGAEFLSGIPCTLGGALYMNAGAGGKYIFEIVEGVMVLRDGKPRILTLSDCEYAYKQSVFMKNDDVILGAYLKLPQATEKEIEEKEEYYSSRRLHLPKGKSMGCVFKNPPNMSAGMLIEEAGLKGYCVGGARISEQHANFIINEKKATSKDIRTLITLVKKEVKARFGVCLEEEIRYLE